MENKSSSAPGTGASEGAKGRRSRRNGMEVNLCYFLPANDSSTTAPKLGQETATEGEALIQAFKSGQDFYTLAVWKAVPEVNGGGSPVIVKQAVTKG